MLNAKEKDLVIGALEQAIASQKRAINTSKVEELKVIYRQIQQELEALKTKVHAIKDK